MGETVRSVYLKIIFSGSFYINTYQYYQIVSIQNLWLLNNKISDKRRLINAWYKKIFVWRVWAGRLGFYYPS